MENDQPIQFSEWLYQKLGAFSASEIYKLFVGSKKIGQLFGDGAMTYIRQKAAELLTMTVKDEMDFKQTNWGTEHEYAAYMWYEDFTKMVGTYYGKHNPKFFKDGEYVGCSPDWVQNDGLTGADFKAPWNSSEHLRNLLLKSVDEFKDVRWEYYCQLQHNMLLQKWTSANFVSYDPRMVDPRLKGAIIKIYPDSEWRDEYDLRITAAIEILGNMINI